MHRPPQPQLAGALRAPGLPWRCHGCWPPYDPAASGPCAADFGRHTADAFTQTATLLTLHLYRPPVLYCLQYVQTSGVVEYDGADGAKAKLTFAPNEVAAGSGPLRPGDHVTFRIAVNLQVSGRGGASLRSPWAGW